jgi:hypothetical protein
MLHWIVIDKAGKLIAHISACSQKQQNNTHHLLWNLWGSISFILYKHAPGNTHTYTYIYIYMSQGKTRRAYPCEYMLLQAWLHTYLYATRSRAGKSCALVCHQRSTGEVRVWPQKKKRLSAFTRSFALPPLNSTSDTACDAHDNACGTNITSTWCKLLSTYTFKSNRPCTSYIVFSPLVVSDGHCQKAKNRPTPLV